MLEIRLTIYTTVSSKRKQVQRNADKDHANLTYALYFKEHLKLQY